MATVNVSTDDPIRITMDLKTGDDKIINTETMEFLATLHRRFEKKRQKILNARKTRQAHLDAGERPDFLAATENDIRKSNWKIRGKNFKISFIKNSDFKSIS
jgi:malate synthase